MVKQLKDLEQGDTFQTGYSDIIFTFYEKVLIDDKVLYKYKDNQLNMFGTNNGELEVSVL